MLASEETWVQRIKKACYVQTRGARLCAAFLIHRSKIHMEEPFTDTQRDFAKKMLAAALEYGLRPLAGSSPWLSQQAFTPGPLLDLAEEIDGLSIPSLELVKAFDPLNHADVAFAADRAPVQWVIENGIYATTGKSCTDPDATISDTLQLVRAPISARVATAPQAATEGLGNWLRRLDECTGRNHRDADVYATAADMSSASLGWHVDDIDVLLVMLRGRKRFRVAGPAVGSAVVIDHWMQPGDVIYIPALTFHSGGDSSSPSSPSTITSTGTGINGKDVSDGSVLLSVAIPVASGKAAQAEALDGVLQWRRARDAVRRRLPSASCNSWVWAGSSEGRKLVRTVLGGSSLERFCL